jgi:hypothetical protein
MIELALLAAILRLLERLRILWLLERLHDLKGEVTRRFEPAVAISDRKSHQTKVRTSGAPTLTGSTAAQVKQAA